MRALLALFITIFSFVVFLQMDTTVQSVLSGRSEEVETVETGPVPSGGEAPGNSTPSSTPTKVYVPFNRREVPRSAGVWIYPEEVLQLPMSGSAWERVKSAALEPLAAKPNLSDRKREQIQAVAKALYYVRTGDMDVGNEVRDAIAAVIGTEGGDALATFRALGGWVIAADLIDLQSFDPKLDNKFRGWLRKFLDVNYSVGAMSLVEAHEVRKGASNWGTHAGFSRAAIAVYLEDGAEIARTAKVFKGFLGDRDESDGDSYTLPDSNFGNLSWQCNPSEPVGINPKGCTKEGHSIDGVLPDDQRRSGDFKWPPPKENYVYGGLQGAVSQAVVLYRAGYDVWSWEDKAILRAFQWLYDVADYPATNDESWTSGIVDYFYCIDRFRQPSTGSGKAMDWADWTHSGSICEDR